MKKTVFQKVIALGLSLSSFLPATPASAQALDTRLGRDANAERATLLAELKRGLSDQGAPIAGLETILSTTHRESPSAMSSSFFFKNLLATTSEDLHRSLSYGTPIAIDPKWSITDLEARLDRQNSLVCVSSLNRQGYVEGGKSGLDQILNSIFFRLVKPRSETTEGIEVTWATERQRVGGLLRAHLDKAPVAAQNRSVKSVLGEVTNVDFFGNRVRRVYLQQRQGGDALAPASNDPIALSLSMLVSFRTGQDEAFVRVQKCLVDYFREQQRVFGARLNEIKRGGRGLLTSAATFQQAGIAGQRIGMAQMLAAPEQNRATAQLKFFFEGHEGFADLSAESSFLEDRLALISWTLPFLESRMRGALNVHLRMSQLTKRQIDYLIDMFLQLSGPDLPVAGDANRISQIIANATSRNDSLGPSDEAEYTYYRQIARDVSDLRDILVEEASREEAKRIDHAAIRQLAR